MKKDSHSSLPSSALFYLKRFGTLVFFIMLASCGAPNTQYLLTVTPPSCEQHTERGVDAPVLGLEDFTTQPGMDRTAVFIAQGNVIQPSTIWYWEGNPAEVMTQAVSDRLSCEGPYRISWPYFGEMENVALLRGRVREFHVAQAESPTFVVRLMVELWAPDHRSLLVEKTITARAQADALTPQATAQAASQAIADATREISTWLTQNKNLVLE